MSCPWSFSWDHHVVFQWSKDSLYPDSRSRATMELSPQLNHIRVRSLHMTVPWQLVIPIVKDTFLTEVVIRHVRNWFFQKLPLKLVNLCLRWWGSDLCLVRLIDKTHLFLKVILITRWLPWVIFASVYHCHLHLPFTLFFLVDCQLEQGEVTVESGGNCENYIRFLSCQLFGQVNHGQNWKGWTPRRGVPSKNQSKKTWFW